MSTSNYSLEVISHHPQFKNKNLRQYYVDGINTVGAWGNEPFEIKFKNNTYQKVQVKISLDGTDVLTGQPANTEVSSKMWVVNGYETLNLKAWPETNNGGASFIFTSANNSVAVHTHGDLSSRGIIAAAVYVEGKVEPIYHRVEHHHHYPRNYLWDGVYIGGVLNTNNTIGGGSFGGPTYSTNSSSFSLNDSDTVVTSNSLNTNDSRSKDLESLVSVGAGDHVDQKITYVSGLIKPTFTETLRVKYLWWDDLQAKLRENNVPAPHASGFPGDRNHNVMSLGNTPRVEGTGRKAEPVAFNYSRV